MKLLAFLSSSLAAQPKPVAADIDAYGIAKDATKEAVAQKAYFAYLDHGGADGHDLKHWFEAEAQINANAASAAGRTFGGRMP